MGFCGGAREESWVCPLLLDHLQRELRPHFSEAELEEGVTPCAWAPPAFLGCHTRLRELEQSLVGGGKLD